MSKVLVEESNLTNIANSIRTKNGTTNTYKPGEMASAIDNISSGVDINDYWIINQPTDSPGSSDRQLQPFIKKVPTLDFSGKTSCTSLFRDCINLLEVQDIKNTENVTTFSSMFQNCGNITEIPNFDTSKGDYFTEMFSGCKNLKKIPQLDFSKGRYLSSLFNNCISLDEILNLNTSNAVSLNDAFSRCKIKKLNKLSCDKVNNIADVLYNCSQLTEFGGFENLGKAYLVSANYNYRDYKLDLSRTALNHDSLMNVINGLYDIASIGVKTQQLILGSTNLAKLTAEEIAIATNKGWTVS